MAGENKPDDINIPPFETADLRANLVKFLDSEFDDPVAGGKRRVGNFRWGVYIFYDYDGEPIYVGQTNEMLRTRIRRHLTNQRTDAVAMGVLDPFEVYEIEVFPLPQFQDVATAVDRAAARAHLNALEHAVYGKAIAGSNFQAILNEKDPPAPTVEVPIPPSFRMRVVSDDVAKIRSHPDFRIARRSLIISRLAQVISERKVQGGLRRVLLTQAKRLQWLADRRYQALGGAASVETENGDEGENE
ncbi:GIY-YIG nuclease family protein [Mesorhizobium sp. ESP7-2]|uniref:GIY-YIG nuclease family protein n=1 Tax=Mesorhizobium sp. ESP7-2 TaxID=2876622 RepID=UPI001CCFBE94|nr:GIY-YIG nuclease family protein [Mesorhizobium sp. ESP7-2]MBZ9711474.1 GIY-YIG nuclease family protein [Mesorhizobium sp. ESP7-2]